jgi:NAD(P)-dependent dehydrogenase (short-subunit alcohol dehydrogenase family)
MGGFYGRVAVVTGGAAGIGFACARALAADGARVVIGDVDPEGGARAAAAIEAAGGVAAYTSVDVTEEAEVRAMVTLAGERFGGLDFAVNNAGIVLSEGLLLHEYPVEDFDRVLRINLHGTFLSLKHELAAMVGAGGPGSIVNVASVAALHGNAGSVAYTASKHAVYGMTKRAAVDYAPRGIRVNAVAPGPTHTSMMDRALESDPEILDRAGSRVPMNRVAQPEEIGEAVRWLLSDAASYVTGELLSIDGGWSAL